MKEWKIKIIIFLMSIAVIGLIAVQLYWITNAFNVEEQKFKSTVNDALVSTVKKLEKRETESVVIKKFADDNGKTDRLFIQMDSTVFPNIYNLPHSYKNDSALKYHFNYNIESLLTSDSANKRTGHINWNAKDSLKERTEIVTIRDRIDSIIIKKRNNVNQVYYQLLTVEPTKPIMQRINANDLDKILLEELTSRGIAADYDWGIRAVGSNGQIITNASDKQALANSEFEARLFPDDLIGAPNYLLLYFPFQKSYVLRNLYVMLSLSAAIIILIVFLFYRTIILLLRQKKISEIKNDFVNNITHEFKTPISTISLACESLAEKEILKNTGAIKRYSKIIADENHRLSDMVENLLNTAIVEKGSFNLNLKEVDLHKVISEVINKYSVLVEDKQGTIIPKLKSTKHFIEADEFHINGILNNLIDNAIKFSPGKPEITISTEDVYDKLKISISDKGIGIEKRNLNKIFETFYRVPTGNIHNTKGYGIGLGYVKKMVAAHGGKMFVYSKPGEGTTFEIIL